MNNQTPKSRWYHEIWFVVLMLFVLGPFAFPLLWKSQKFSRSMKWILSVSVIVVTILAIWGSVEVFKMIWKQFQELQASLS